MKFGRVFSVFVKEGKQNHHNHRVPAQLDPEKLRVEGRIFLATFIPVFFETVLK